MGGNDEQQPQPGMETTSDQQQNDVEDCSGGGSGDTGTDVTNTQGSKTRHAKVNPGSFKRLQKRRADEEMQILKSLAAAVSAPEPEHEKRQRSDVEDEDVAFGQYIISELKKIINQRTKLILKNTMTNAIFHARLESMASDGNAVSAPAIQYPGSSYGNAHFGNDWQWGACSEVVPRRRYYR